jgi:tRNA (cytidine/uridine-2'-O-)-methyltransferase
MSVTDEKIAPFRVVLVEPEIPPNTGTIARLCAATRCELHLIEPLGFELSDRTLKRAGMDYWKQCVWRAWPSFTALREGYPDANFWFLTTKTKRTLWKATLKQGDFLVFGRETKGLPEALLEANESRCLTLPMYNPNSRSLNLATAVAAVVYEGLRQISTGTDLC